MAALNSYQEGLFSHYSEIRFSSWAPLVPDPDLIKDGPEDGTTDDAQAIAIASSPIIFANEEMAIPAILYSLMMNIVLLIYVGVVRKKSR